MSLIMKSALRPNGLRAVIFDMDGTLIQTTIDFHAMNRAVTDTLLRHGLPKAVLDPSGRVNESIARAYAYLHAQGREERAEALELDLNRVTAEVEMARVEESVEVPGAGDVLEGLRSRGMRSAVLTRGSREYTTRALRASGLEGWFDIVVCRDDHPLTEAKPNPLALQRVHSALGLLNRECLFIGDHEIDLRCAKGAGSPFVAVLTGSNDQRAWDRLGAEMVISSVADLPEILERGC